MYRCLSTCRCTNEDVSIAVVWKQPDNLVITTCTCIMYMYTTKYMYMTTCTRTC